MIYLASPYSHQDRAVEEMRYRSVIHAAARLIQDGHIIYAPIGHCHAIAPLMSGNPTTHTPWKAYNEGFLDESQELWIFMLEGWQTSRGIAHEFNYARTLELPLKVVSPQDYSIRSVTYEEIETLLMQAQQREHF